jgi:L-cysteine/cystine lyase
VQAEQFRVEFPVLERCAYLNTGTDGPLPRRSVEAATAELERELRNGRSGVAHFARLGQLAEELRGRLAKLLGAGLDEVALTRSTTDGINVVLSGLGLVPGDEVLTSDEEHPGLLAPLGALRERGVAVRAAPFDDVADAVQAQTKLIAVSHVSWMRGRIAAVQKLRRSGVPLLLDGAQGLGAIPVDAHALGCDFYAAAGQKWLCGPDGTGVLFVREPWIDELGVPWPNFMTLRDVERPLELLPGPGARRFDGGMVSGQLAAGALASLQLLDEAGWQWIFERARRQSERLRELLTARVELLPGGPTTLVTWQPPGVSDMEGAVALVERLEGEGVVVRAFPGRPWLRASVGAWNSDEDLERLVAAC